jgi:hypothetical protein
MSAFTDLSNNKIGDSTGDTTCLWFFVGHFLLAYLFHFNSVSESVGDPSRLSGSESSLRPFVLFPKFLLFTDIFRTVLYIQPAETFDFRTLTVYPSANFPHPTHS